MTCKELECLKRIDTNNYLTEREHREFYSVVEKALIKEQEHKQYLKWEDLEFNYGTKEQKVKMGDTIYKIVYSNYDNTKEVQLFSEDEKYIYFHFFGNFEEHVQLFNDLHLEVLE